MSIQFHPACLAFPSAEAEDRERIKASMVASGFDPSFPIVTVDREGVRWIVDGRNRYQVALELNLEPVYLLKDFSEAEIWRYAINANLNRRHLSVSQRSALAVELLPALRYEAKGRKVRKPANSVHVILHEQPDPAFKNQSIAQAGALVGVSGASVAKALRLAQDDPIKFAEVKAGKANVFKAVRDLPPRNGKPPAKKKRKAAAPLPDNVQQALRGRGKTLGCQAPLLIEKLGDLPEPMRSYVFAVVVKSPECIGIREDDLDWSRIFPGLCEYAGRKLAKLGCWDPALWQKLVEKVALVSQVERVEEAIRGDLKTPLERHLASRPKVEKPVNRLYEYTGTDKEGICIARLIEQLEKYLSVCVRDQVTMRATGHQHHTSRHQFLRNLALVIYEEVQDPKRWLTTLQFLSENDQWSEGMFTV